MNNFLLDNSYKILGLNNDATQKEILKRANEITNLLKIDDLPEYDTDFDDVKKYRTESNVKEALHGLADPKKRIREYFFNLDLQNETDALEDLKKGDFDNVIKKWSNLANDGSINSLFYEKKQAILLTLILLTKSAYKNYLNESIQLWKHVYESDLFWNNFIKSFKLDDDLNTNEDLINSFKKNFPSLLADLYSDISKVHDDKSYFSEFTKEFSVTGEKLEKEVLEKIYLDIQQIVEDLDSLKVSADGKFDIEEKKVIKDALQKLQEKFNELIEFGLYEDSKTKVMRDKAAEAIHKVTLDLHNNLNETEMSQAMLEIALGLSGTMGLQHKLSKDTKIMVENKKEADLLAPVDALIEQEDHEEALARLENLGKHHTLSSFIAYKKGLLTAIAIKRQKEAMDFLEKEKYEKSSENFLFLQTLIMDNIELFDLNKDFLNDLITDIKNRLESINQATINALDDYRNKIIEKANAELKDSQAEFSILIVLTDSYIYPDVIDWIKRKKSRNSVASVLYFVGFFALAFYGLGVLIWIFAWWYSKQD